MTTKSQLSFAAILIAKCLSARIRLSFNSIPSKRINLYENNFDNRTLFILGFSLAVFIFVFCSIKFALIKN